MNIGNNFVSPTFGGFTMTEKAEKSQKKAETNIYINDNYDYLQQLKNAKDKTENLKEVDLIIRDKNNYKLVNPASKETILGNGLKVYHLVDVNSCEYDAQAGYDPITMYEYIPTKKVVLEDKRFFKPRKLEIITETVEKAKTMAEDLQKLKGLDLYTAVAEIIENIKKSRLDKIIK